MSEPVFIVLPIEAEQKRELQPLLNEAWNQSRCIIGDVLPGHSGAVMRWRTISRKAWVKVRKILDAEEPC